MKQSIREMIVEITYYLVWLDVIWRNRINFFEKIFLWISNEIILYFYHKFLFKEIISNIL